MPWLASTACRPASTAPRCRRSCPARTRTRSLTRRPRFALAAISSGRPPARLDRRGRLACPLAAAAMVWPEPGARPDRPFSSRSLALSIVVAGLCSQYRCPRLLVPAQRCRGSSAVLFMQSLCSRRHSCRLLPFNLSAAPIPSAHRCSLIARTRMAPLRQMSSASASGSASRSSAPALCCLRSSSASSRRTRARSASSVRPLLRPAQP